jgi:hypothetical protein
VDLRVENIRTWQERFTRIKGETEKIAADDTSSAEHYSLDYWEGFRTVPIGKIAAWIFTVEDEGARMKA